MIMYPQIAQMNADSPVREPGKKNLTTGALFL